MISTNEMRKANGRLVRLAFTDGTVLEKICTHYYQSEDDEEEPMLEFEDVIVNQSEIKFLEVL